MNSLFYRCLFCLKLTAKATFGSSLGDSEFLLQLQAPKRTVRYTGTSSLAFLPATRPQSGWPLPPAGRGQSLSQKVAERRRVQRGRRGLKGGAERPPMETWVERRGSGGG